MGRGGRSAGQTRFLGSSLRYFLKTELDDLMFFWKCLIPFYLMPWLMCWD